MSYTVKLIQNWEALGDNKIIMLIVYSHETYCGYKSSNVFTEQFCLMTVSFESTYTEE